jgi:hypothetical protein
MIVELAPELSCQTNFVMIPIVAVCVEYRTRFVNQFVALIAVAWIAERKIVVLAIVEPGRKWRRKIVSMKNRINIKVNN